jgi:uncharacterized OB-fold protein
VEQPQRPLPRFPEPDTEPFWRMTREHRLGYQVCEDCGGIVFYPRRHCTHCTSERLAWRESAGRGRIYTYTVIRQHGHPAFREMLPFVVAFVDLDEGFRILTHIIDCSPEDVQVGQPVEVAWIDAGEVSLPVFRPVAQTA